MDAVYDVSVCVSCRKETVSLVDDNGHPRVLSLNESNRSFLAAGVFRYLRYGMYHGVSFFVHEVHEGSSSVFGWRAYGSISAHVFDEGIN